MEKLIVLFSILFLTLAQEYELPVYGCTVRKIPANYFQEKCIYVPGSIGINFFGAKCIIYSVNKECPCVGSDNICRPQNGCSFTEIECFWDWRSGKEGCEKSFGPIAPDTEIYQCNRDEWKQPLSIPPTCELRLIRFPKCKPTVLRYGVHGPLYDCVATTYEGECDYGKGTNFLNINPNEYSCRGYPYYRLNGRLMNGTSRNVYCSYRLGGCFGTQDDIMEKCENEGVPNERIYECSDNRMDIVESEEGTGEITSGTTVQSSYKKKDNNMYCNNMTGFGENEIYNSLSNRIKVNIYVVIFVIIFLII
jgi:hypothetical protein